MLFVSFDPKEAVLQGVDHCPTRAVCLGAFPRQGASVDFCGGRIRRREPMLSPIEEHLFGLRILGFPIVALAIRGFL